MSDEQLRALERRWRASGTVEDEAAYLRERVRAGDLRQERLELAAYLGNEAAILSLGEKATRLPAAPKGRVQLFNRLHEDLRASKEVMVRGALAALNHDLPQLNGSNLRVLRAAEDWVLNPNERSLAAVGAALLALKDRNPVVFNLGRAAASTAAHWRAAGMGAEGWSDDAIESAEAAECATIVACFLGTEKSGAAVRGELALWALGYADPIRMRVAKRGETEIWPEDLRE